MDDDELQEVLQMLYGEHVTRQRLLNAKLFEPQRRWVDPRGYRLSDRIWRNGQKYRRQIDAILREGIRRGDSAETIARKLREFVDPEYAPLKYQKNGRVLRVRGMVQRPNAASASRSLARTEIQRVHRQSTIDRARGVPGVKGIKWALSLAHPAHDVCDGLAAADDHNLGPGVYPVDQVPEIPHPNCMCHTRPVHPPREETRGSIAARYREAIFAEAGVYPNE